MTQSKPDGSSQDPVTKLLDILTPEQQEALRRKLNEKAWDAQNRLLQARQAVALALFTEQSLKQRLQQNKEQVATCQAKADTAAQQHNEELRNQALKLKQEYEKSSSDLEDQLKSSSESMIKLRKRFSELESEVAELYVKKQLLATRESVALATMQAKEILSRTEFAGAVSLLDRMEQKVAERERAACGISEPSENLEGKQETDVDAMLAKATESINRLNSLIEQIEDKVGEHDTQASVGQSSGDNPAP